MEGIQGEASGVDIPPRGTANYRVSFVGFSWSVMGFFPFNFYLFFYYYYLILSIFYLSPSDDSDETERDGAIIRQRQRFVRKRGGSFDHVGQDP